MRSSARRVYSNARRTIHRSFGAVKDAWLEMIMALAVGFYFPSFLSNLGVGDVVYQNVPVYSKIVDTLYNASGGNAKWGQGGLRGFAALYGGADAANQTMKAAHAGGFSRGSLVKTAFDLGLVFDSPNPSYGGSGGSSGSYW